MPNPQQWTGRELLLQLFVDEGITHFFGNPGTTELAIMEAVPHFPQLKYVLGLQESVVVGMADGFARASGRLAACNLHCAPGLGNAMGALYNAKFSGAPLIVTAGQYEIGYGLQEPMLYEPLVRIAEPLVKWAVEVPRVEDLPRIIHRAAKTALAPPAGPVFISLPGSVLDDTANIDRGTPTRIDANVRPTDEALQTVARKILAARNPAIIAGKELADHDAFGEAQELAERAGAAVYLEPVPYNARFPSEHIANMGDLTRSQPKVRQTLERHDLIVCLGADLLRMSPFSTVDPMPPGVPVVHITDRAAELGKNYATDVALCANVKVTLQALLPVLCGMQSEVHAQEARHRLEQLATRNWSAQRARAREQALQSATTSPIDPRYLMSCLADALPANAIVVEEALTAAPALNSLVPVRDATGFYGLASGGLGFALSGAIGISLARPGRPVVAAVGDGSAMYSVQALWTAAHLKLPVTYVIVNNRGYRIIKERLVALRGSERFVGMDLREPDLDFVALARGFGMHARRITDPAALPSAIKEAVASGAPNLIDIATADGF